MTWLIRKLIEGRRPHPPQPSARRFRPHLETVEDRCVPATLFHDGGATLHYFPAPGVANNLTIRTVNNGLAFEDTAEPITFFSPLGVPLNVQGNGTNRVHLPPVVVFQNGPRIVAGGYAAVRAQLGGESDSLTIQSTRYFITAVTGAGADTVRVGDLFGTLDGVLGFVSLVADAPAAGGTDRLVIDDSANASDHSYLATPTQVARDRIGPVNHTGFDEIELLAGQGNDLVQLAGTPEAAQVTIRGGGRDDTLRFVAANALANTRGPVRFEGGPGSNWLDYAGQPTDVRVDLGDGTATGLARGIADVQNVIGGAGDDELEGNSANNILLGGAGEDELDGGDGRDLLIGGDNEDDLDGGGQEDILIGGTTVHDASPTALRAVMAEWERGISRADRMRHLRNETAGGFNGTTFLRLNIDVLADGDDDAFDDGEWELRDNAD